MANLAAIVLKDNANADVSFTPMSVENNTATVVNSNGVPIGDRKIIFGVQKTASGRRKVGLRLHLPIVQDMTVNGITRPTAVRTSYVEIQFSFDEGSSTAERADVLALTKALLANVAQIRPVVVDLESPW